MKKYEIVILKKAAIELRDQEDYIRSSRTTRKAPISSFNVF